jgi:hypothetical protein
MIQNKIPRLCFFICSLVQNSEHFPPLRNGSERNSESFLFRGMTRTKFRDFASIFVPWYRIPSISPLWGTVRNGIPRVFCSAEQPEFRRNKAIVPSIPSSAEIFFCRKLPTLFSVHRGHRDYFVKTGIEI